MKKISLLLIGFVLVGCSSAPQETTQKIVVGVMPSMDSAPILWAQHEGYFEDLGLEVELIVYSNGNDRDTQVQTNAVDMVVTDIMGLVAMREAGYDVVGLSATQTLFSLISKDVSLPNSPASVAMAEVSVTQYIADLALADFEITKQFVDAVPQRLEMVAQDLVDGAILPEPTASMAVVSGLQRLVLEADSPNVLMWQQASVESKASSITLFYEAYNKAVDTMMDDENALKDVLIEKLSLDEAVRDAIVFPEYTHAKAVSQTTFEDVIAWMHTTLNMDTTETYEAAVNNAWVDQ